MIVNLASLLEYRYYDPQLSWRAKVNYERVYDLECESCHKLNLNALGGLSFKPKPSSVFNIMLGAFGEASKYFIKGMRAGPQMELSFYSEPVTDFKLGLLEEIKFDGWVIDELDSIPQGVSRNALECHQQNKK